MLWLAVHLPDLPLEALGQDPAATEPVAISEGQSLVRVNRAAAGGGVQPGQTPSEARALLPALRLHPRQTDAEANALHHLADWAYQFSSQVSPQAPDGLLVETGGSQRLFGGHAVLHQRITQGLEALGYSHRTGAAPTPTAAWLLARADAREVITDPAALPDALGALPVAVLDLPPAQHQALTGLGLWSLGDCLALPRRDLARRFGAQLLLRIERALGERPDPRASHSPATRFHRYLELPDEAHDAQSLGFALQRLLRELAGLLRGLEGGAQELALDLHHRHQPPTELVIGLLRPARDPEHLLTLCQHRLDRTPLAAPVTALCLRVENILQLPPESVALLPDHEADTGAAHWQLAERLGARLGEDAVTGLSTAADHRPERAWRTTSEPATTAHPPFGERPFWLLANPEPLPVEHGRPCWHGPLRLECGPERIETGWWDGHDVSRDYYHARNPQGSRLWIFRERRGTGAWYLHGVFA